MDSLSVFFLFFSFILPVFAFSPSFLFILFLLLSVLLLLFISLSSPNVGLAFPFLLFCISLSVFEDLSDSVECFCLTIVNLSVSFPSNSLPCAEVDSC